MDAFSNDLKRQHEASDDGTGEEADAAATKAAKKAAKGKGSKYVVCRGRGGTASLPAYPFSSP